MWPSLLRLWTGPLPDQELFPSRKYNPLIHWLAHPLKRRLAKYYLLLLQKLFGLTVIGITGSAGKTTTKDMLHAILTPVAPTVATTANITPTYNIPTTILRCRPGTKYLILEMGIEYPGDMDFYLWLARPDIAILTSIGPTHLEHLGTIDNVRAEKTKIAAYAKHFITFENTPLKANSYQLPASLLGNHFQHNAALAAQAAETLGISLKAISYQLSVFTPPPHRMQLIPLEKGYLIDDTYNANPLATKEALKTLFEFAKQKKLTPAFVFGQMNELGSVEKSAHAEIGKLIKKLAKNYKLSAISLYCLGPATEHTIASAGFGKYFENQTGLYHHLTKFLLLKSSFVILVKGSRSWHLENLVQQLIQTR